MEKWSVSLKLTVYLRSDNWLYVFFYNSFIFFHFVFAIPYPAHFPEIVWVCICLFKDKFYFYFVLSLHFFLHEGRNTWFFTIVNC